MNSVLHGFKWRARPGGAALPIVTAMCALLSACGNGFMAEASDMETASGCVSGRLGCVTEQNIAAVAARPSDLARPRRVQPRDTARRDAVISAYRHGGSRAPNAGSTGGTTTLQEGNR
jgi:type IV pilus biogenesis protein CpaD/CtpE